VTRVEPDVNFGRGWVCYRYEPFDMDRKVQRVATPAFLKRFSPVDSGKEAK
jgi:hypothetical protein